MGKRQREWAKNKRLKLVEALGGKCANCGTTNDLDIDHIDGKPYLSNSIDQSMRVTRYYREYKSGVRLRVLCGLCNSLLRPKIFNHEKQSEPAF